MTHTLPVPPNSMRIPAAQSIVHSMDNVYMACLEAVKTFNSSENWIKDGAFFDSTMFEDAPNPNSSLLTPYNRLLISCRVAMFKDTAKNVKPAYKDMLVKILHMQSTEPASALAHCLTKYGWFRQIIASCRVNMSGRTVCVGNPDLMADQVGIPPYFAQQLFTPRRVNNCNINALKAMIDNYPNYPCAIKYVDRRGKIIAIKPEIKQMILNQVSLGDIVCIQLMDNDIVAVNRYPSIREESFTALRAKIIPGSKALQFSLQVIAKMNADFDGDETQLFVFASKSDELEALGLMSTFKHFITYETGLNLIGGKGAEDNVFPGTFHLKTSTFKWGDFRNVLRTLTNYGNPYAVKKEVEMPNWSEKCSGLEVVEFVINTILKLHGYDPKQLNYSDADKHVVIENGHVKAIDTDMMQLNSQFLTFMFGHYPAAVPVNMLDILSHIGYQANKVNATTIENNGYLSKQQAKEDTAITDERVRVLQ